MDVMRSAGLLLLLSLGTTSVAGEKAPAAAADLFPADLLQISSTGAFSKHVFLVDKKERKLLVFERDGETIRRIDEIAADIGKNDGNKQKENDHRTPEGIYFFQRKISAPEIPFALYGKMAFTTDYPNVFDLRQKKTGSGIWLHSIPETVPLTRGSRGCVVIRNDQLAKIEDYIKFKQTPIIIYDKIEYVSKAEHDKRRTELSQWLESWRAAWESQKTDEYLGFYDKDFKAPGFASYEAWDKHKRRVGAAAKAIKVTLHQPFLLLHKDQLIIKMLQKYESDLHADYGVKTIHAIRSPAGYRIIREEWTKADESGQTASLVSELPAWNGRLTD